MDDQSSGNNHQLAGQAAISDNIYPLGWKARYRLVNRRIVPDW
jgi:hypothetical protein